MRYEKGEDEYDSPPKREFLWHTTNTRESVLGVVRPWVERTEIEEAAASPTAFSPIGAMATSPAGETLKRN